MLANYHTHLRYCDGKGSLAEYLSAAHDLDLISIGFSSHAPLPFPCSWCMKDEELHAYLSEIRVAKATNPQVEIYSGLEVDYIPGVTGPSRFREHLDYTIGSIHFVDTFKDGTPWEIDGPHHLFLKGLQEIFGNDIQSAVRRYFELTREMIERDTPDIIGHLDKIKIQNINGALWSETADWYQAELMQTLDAVAKHGGIIEVNTRGMYQGKTAEPYPGIQVLQEILRKKIPITINSDAHHPDQLVKGFADAQKILIRLGFQGIMVLQGGQWQSKKLMLHGAPY